MRALVLTAFLAALGAPDIAVPEKKQKSPQDLMQGTWQMDKFEAPGKNGPPPNEITGLKLEIQGNKITIIPPPGAGGPGGKDATFTLDTTKKPICIDIMPQENDGRVVLGIMAVDQNTLKLCFREGQNVQRPTDFTPDATAGTMHLKHKK